MSCRSKLTQVESLSGLTQWGLLGTLPPGRCRIQMWSLSFEGFFALWEPRFSMNKCLFTPDRASVTNNRISAKVELGGPVNVLVYLPSMGEGVLKEPLWLQSNHTTAKSHPTVNGHGSCITESSFLLHTLAPFESTVARKRGTE